MRSMTSRLILAFLASVIFLSASGCLKDDEPEEEGGGLPPNRIPKPGYLEKNTQKRR
jgi:hypothetical protein